MNGRLERTSPLRSPLTGAFGPLDERTVGQANQACTCAKRIKAHAPPPCSTKFLMMRWKVHPLYPLPFSLVAACVWDGCQGGD